MNYYDPRPLFAGLAFTLSLFPMSAHAYIDPGTGSLLLQGLIGAVAGVMVAASLYWTKIKRFFRMDKGSDASPPSNVSPDDPQASLTSPLENKNGTAKIQKPESNMDHDRNLS